MNTFPLPDNAFNALHALSKNPSLRDKGRYRFDGVVYTARRLYTANFGGTTRAISKSAAKHDKRAAKAQRQDGIRPRVLPVAFARAAGRVNRFGSQSNTNEYIK